MAGYLEEQLADLKISLAEVQQHKPLKKPGPAVPPKPKKAQPQVPRSQPLKGPNEPLFSTPLQSLTQNPIYNNLDTSSEISSTRKDKSNFNDAYINIDVVKDCKNSYKTTSEDPYKQNSVGPIYCNTANTLNNFDLEPNYANIDDLLLPKVGSLNDFPPPPVDLPPPSPVSSSYSELRRATQSNTLPEYETYTPPSQVSSAYDSLYEPITPRPPSGLSSRSNYSIYAPYSTKSSRSEAEVDALTDLLVQSMDSPSCDPEFFGNCTVCGERVMGEENGCTAMDKVYHIDCFACTHCNMPLQGKQFYVLEGKPYCETGYLQTLEKCSVCFTPILDRILRATGRPYHPQCFCCVVCGKSLDGIPFTVDATNQIHCIEDFHKKFAPRCCVCQQPIMPEPGKEETVRVVALDRSFHVNCYRCEDCGLLLSSEPDGAGCYPLDDHVLCKSCNAKRVQALTSCMTTDL